LIIKKKKKKKRGRERKGGWVGHYCAISFGQNLLNELGKLEKKIQTKILNK
jgi:hypothetical protein